MLVLKFSSILMLIMAVNSQTPEECWENPSQRWPHENCEMYYECDENDEIIETWCEIGEVFDSVYLECGVDSICDWDTTEPGENGDICPLDSQFPSFVHSEENCEYYYFCINGFPHAMECRQGQHFNRLRGYCDDPHVAGCDDTAVAPPPSAPTACSPGVTGTLPHPVNCNQFIYCFNGSTLIQNCPHLLHYDIIQKRCIFHSIAVCIRDKTAIL